VSVNIAEDIRPPQPVAQIVPGHVLGRYELLLPLAAGGMAMVWAARLKGSRGFQKIVAIKTMLPRLSDDAQFEQMFLDEASLASQIRHPNVVEISDLGEHEGVLFLVMEWIDGVPLNQLMKAAKPSGGVPLPIAVRIVMQACAGLHAAHELRDPKGQLVGLVHRDISPQNILVSYEGVTKVVDFGVAKATAMGGGVTMAGQLKGKVSYMAPEQVRGDDIDRRVDIFAMGIVLYALTTGKHPFRRENEAATMYTLASSDPVVPPHKLIPDYPPELENVVLKALAKDPKARYSTANEFLRGLDQALPFLPRANGGAADEDIGEFVDTLLGTRRAEGRAALADALERADKQALDRASNAFSEISNSQVSAMSPIAAGSSVAPEARTLTEVGAPTWPPALRKRMILALVVVAALGVGAGLLLAKRSRSKHATFSPSPPRIELVTPHVDAPALSTQGPSLASPTALPAPSVVVKAPPPVLRWVAPPLDGGAGTQKAPRRSWRDDPGF
jgi:eukaryotic-like serine/threonine-protein kinase